MFQDKHLTCMMMEKNPVLQDAAALLNIHLRLDLRYMILLTTENNLFFFVVSRWLTKKVCSSCGLKRSVCHTVPIFPCSMVYAEIQVSLFQFPLTTLLWSSGAVLLSSKKWLVMKEWVNWYKGKIISSDMCKQT